MSVRAFFIAVVLLLASSAEAFDISHAPNMIFRPNPAPVIRLEKSGRMPASVADQKAKAKAVATELDEKLTLGSYALVQGSSDKWNNQVVQIIGRFDDGSRKVKFDSNEGALVRFDNLKTLSPETKKCCPSNGVEICPGDEKVYHPIPSTSLGPPEGKVVRIFENCAVQVRDGLDFLYEAEQLGKPVECNSKKGTAICNESRVLAGGYRNGKYIQFEGIVKQNYTNGVALVRELEAASAAPGSSLWLFPVEAASLNLLKESLEGPVRSPASTSPKNQGGLPLPTAEEIEPFDANDQHGPIESRGVSIPVIQSR